MSVVVVRTLKCDRCPNSVPFPDESLPATWSELTLKLGQQGSPTVGHLCSTCRMALNSFLHGGSYTTPVPVPTAVAAATAKSATPPAHTPTHPSPETNTAAAAAAPASSQPNGVHVPYVPELPPEVDEDRISEDGEVVVQTAPVVVPEFRSPAPEEGPVDAAPAPPIPKPPPATVAPTTPAVAPAPQKGPKLGAEGGGAAAKPMSAEQKKARQDATMVRNALMAQGVADGMVYSDDVFRAHVRGALGLSKIGDERYEAMRKEGAGEACLYWHQSMHNGKAMVVMGARPKPGGKATPPAMPKDEPAGEDLESEVADYELQLREVLAQSGLDEEDVDSDVGHLATRAMVRPTEDLSTQPKTNVTRYRDLLQERYAEVTGAEA